MLEGDWTRATQCGEKRRVADTHRPTDGRGVVTGCGNATCSLE